MIRKRDTRKEIIFQRKKCSKEIKREIERDKRERERINKLDKKNIHKVELLSIFRLYQRNK